MSLLILFDISNKNDPLSKVKIYTMAVSRFRNDVLLCGTSAGIIILDILNDQKV